MLLAPFQERFSHNITNLLVRVQIMAEETQIIELSGLAPQEIARRVLDILNEGRVQRFTVLLRRGQKNDSRTSNSLLQLDQTDGKSFSTQKSYRISHFDFLHRSSNVSNNDSLASSTENISPVKTAMRLYALGQYSQALDALTVLKEQGQASKELLVGIANCKFHLGHYEEAVQMYRTIIAQHCTPQDLRSPQAAQIYNNLGSAYARLNLEKPSMNAFAHAVEIYALHPHMDCSPLYSNIAGIYLKAGMPAAAQGYYLKALAERKQKRPGHKELLLHCHRRVAQAQAQLGKFQEAESHLSKASKLAQTVGGLQETLKEEAALRQRQGKWQQAIDFYEKLHVLVQEQQEEGGCKGFLYENASRIYQKMGKASEHRKYLDKAVRQYRKSGNQAKVSQLENVGKVHVQVLTDSRKTNL